MQRNILEFTEEFSTMVSKNRRKNRRKDLDQSGLMANERAKF